MPDELRVPRGVDPRTPNIARMYDFFLGGKDNFAADRAAADTILKLCPDAPAVARANRAFMRRAVRHLSAEGVTQFLDIGSGLPTQGNVHDVAVGARVTYVDYDPMVHCHTQALLGSAPDVSAIQADLRRPEDILGHPDLGLDLSRPVGLLLVAIMHYVPDEDKAHDLLARYRDALAPGSHLVMTHATYEGLPEDIVASGRELYTGATAQIVPRSRDEIMRFFDGFELLEPGLIGVSDWRPDETNAPRSLGYAGVGRK